MILTRFNILFRIGDLVPLNCWKLLPNWSFLHLIENRYIRQPELGVPKHFFVAIFVKIINNTVSSILGCFSSSKLRMHWIETRTKFNVVVMSFSFLLILRNSWIPSTCTMCGGPPLGNKFLADQFSRSRLHSGARNGFNSGGKLKWGYVYLIRYRVKSLCAII